MNNVLKIIPPKAGLTTYKPSAAESRYIEEGLGFLNMTDPFFSAMLYSTMVIKFTRDVPYAATDSHVVYVNVDGMKAQGWTCEEVAFVLAHEVLHYILGDLIMSVYWREQSSIICPDGSVLPYFHDEMNVAMDLRINAMLIDGKVGKFPKIGWFNPAISDKGMESCVEIYIKRYQQGGGSGAGQQKQLGGGFDQHLEPSQQAVEQDKATGALAKAQAIASAKMVAEAAGMGKLPAALAALIGEILSPKVSWQDHLKASMQRAAGDPRHNWAKVNKRLISRPAPWGKIAFAKRESYGCGTVVVGYDTSGSCANAATQQRFFSEMSGIVADLNPRELIVVWCDAKVQRVDILEDATDLEMLRADINDAGGAPGGGGTDLRKIFDHIKDEGIEPDMLVVLTDMLTPFPYEPDYQTIWASIRPDMKAPFGTLVEIPEE